MPRFRALRPMKYATRRLQAGDVFEATPAHGRILISVKRAEPVRDAAALDPIPAKLKRKAEAKAAKPVKEEEPPAPEEPVVDDVAQIQEPAEDDLGELRAEYEQKIGKRPFYGWDADTLREKMAEATANQPEQTEEQTGEQQPEEATSEDAS